MSSGPPLRGERVRLRSGKEGDVPTLVAMFADPEVRGWWRTNEADKVRSRFDEDGLFGWVIEAEGEVVGWIQAYEEDDPEYRHAGIDLATSPSVHGTGVALDALRAVMGWLTGERGHHRLTIDPSAANARAIRAYEKVGFRRVGVMRCYERAEDGRWHDGLLMEHVVGIDDSPS